MRLNIEPVLVKLVQSTNKGQTKEQQKKQNQTIKTSK